MIKSASSSSILTNEKHSSMSAGAVPSNEYLIATTVTSNSTTAYVDFDVSAYNGVYKHLKIVALTHGTTVGTAADEVLIYFNGDTNTANYHTHRMYNNNTGGVASASWTTSSYISQNPRSSTSSTAFLAAEIDILDPYSTTKNTTSRSLFGISDSHWTIVLNSVGWYNTAAVTSIRLAAEANYFSQNCRFSLYGVTA